MHTGLFETVFKRGGGSSDATLHAIGAYSLAAIAEKGAAETLKDVVPFGVPLAVPSAENQPTNTQPYPTHLTSWDKIRGNGIDRTTTDQ